MLTDEELEQIEHANASQRRAVVFLHGLWLLPSSWDRWRERFARGGYATITPCWPNEAPVEHGSVDGSAELIAGMRIEAVAQHSTEAIEKLYRKPIIIGHSFGGLIAQMLAGRGLAKVTVAIEPAPFRGVLPLPASPLRPTLRHPSNRNRAVPLSYEQFCAMFADSLEDEEARTLYEQFVVPAPAGPLFEAATANLNPRTEVRVDTGRATRGPLLIISGEHDRMFPWAVANGCYQRQRRNHQVTEIVEVPGGHSVTIDHAWEKIADIAYEFIERFTSAS